MEEIKSVYSEIDNIILTHFMLNYDIKHKKSAKELFDKWNNRLENCIKKLGELNNIHLKMIGKLNNIIDSLINQFLEDYNLIHSLRLSNET